MAREKFDTWNYKINYTDIKIISHIYIPQNLVSRFKTNYKACLLYFSTLQSLIYIVYNDKIKKHLTYRWLALLENAWLRQAHYLVKSRSNKVALQSENFETNLQRHAQK